MKRAAKDPRDPGAAYDAAIRLLQHRWRGREELRRRLSDRGFEADAVAEAITRCEREGWIDDVRFAGEMARSKIHKHGRSRIESDLLALGVGRDAIEAGLAPYADEESATMEKVARRKLSSLRSRRGNEGLDPGVLTMKVASFLSQRGFSASSVYPLIEELRRELEQETNEDI